MGLIKINGEIKDKDKEKQNNKIAVHPRLKKQDYIRVSQQVTTNINLPSQFQHTILPLAFNSHNIYELRLVILVS